MKLDPAVFRLAAEMRHAGTAAPLTVIAARARMDTSEYVLAMGRALSHRECFAPGDTEHRVLFLLLLAELARTGDLP